MRVKILGVPIDAVTEKEALERVRDFLDEPRGHLITTPNPEMLVLARQDRQFAEVLQKADLAIPDGAGLAWAAGRQGQKLPARVTGADFAVQLAGLAAETHRTIFLLGAAEGIAAAAAKTLKEKFPVLKIAGAMRGGDLHRDADGWPRLDDDSRRQIQAAAPDILLVAYGHGTQEKWIAANLSRLPSVRVAMGVGGTFDFLAGKVRRAPRFMRKAGLEWLWRLIIQPWRLKRIWTAVAVFPYLVLTGKG